MNVATELAIRYLQEHPFCRAEFLDSPYDFEFPESYFEKFDLRTCDIEIEGVLQMFVNDSTINRVSINLILKHFSELEK